MSESNQIRYIDPVIVLGGKLLTVEKPARYAGGEIGRLAIKEKPFRTVIAFPDLYEIGMGNQALRIIYNNLNNLQNVSCDRAFAPAPDFENILRRENIPLYGLDTGISLACADLLMFTLGYELGLNGILTMLDVSGIPPRNDQRNNDHPIVIAGGPVVSNPKPYSPFIDAFWIGEAEEGFFDLVSGLSRFKEEGQGRAELLEKISAHQNIWVKDKEKTGKAIYKNFGVAVSNDLSQVYPVPSMKIVQNHGAVEIMRGCPNGCRFCHAGFWYRPARQKEPLLIEKQVNDFVNKGGWRQISLSSLSSGDYEGIDALIDSLNNQFPDKHVSFQLPSLKVSTFALSILNKISVTRKSGLTFAVETPRDAWQMSINKEVTRDSVVAIIEEARKSGWKGVKFYFMIGLPVHGAVSGERLAASSEEEEIVEFVADIGRRTRMRFNINVGIYIPKPHTPYQRSVQLDSETAFRKLNFIRSRLKPMGHKVSVSDTLIARIEGLMSRGDERAGLLCEEAWKNGSRLDPWSEFINKNKWLEILDKNADYAKAVFDGKIEPLPWACIDSCVTEKYLCKELEKSDNSQRTSSCREKCNNCGVCDFFVKTSRARTIGPSHREVVSLGEAKDTDKREGEIFVNHEDEQVNKEAINKGDPEIFRILFSFCKEESAVFHGHLSLIEIFSMSFVRAGIPVMYTRGFNPLAKIMFASPLSIGVAAKCEIAAADFGAQIFTEDFVKKLNQSLPEGIRIRTAESFTIKSGAKKHSLASLLWGYAYEAADGGIDYVNAKDEKAYRQTRLQTDCKTLCDLKRVEVLAKDTSGTGYVSYFNIYKNIYKDETNRILSAN